MKTFKIILAVLFLFVLCSGLSAQGNCHGDNIKVYKGANGCGCKCMKECVTPAELSVYLANGWNTEGCWNCCKLYNGGWVDAILKTSLDEVVPGVEAGVLTISYTLASDSDVKIRVTDMTGRCVATVVDEHKEGLGHEIIWDSSNLNPGVYLLSLSADGVTDTKKISVTN